MFHFLKNKSKVLFFTKSSFSQSPTFLKVLFLVLVLWIFFLFYKVKRKNIHNTNTKNKTFNLLNKKRRETAVKIKSEFFPSFIKKFGNKMKFEQKREQLKKKNMRFKKLGNLFYSEINLPHNSECIKNQNDLLFLGPLGCNQIALRKVDPAGIGLIKVLAGGKSIYLSSQSKSFIGVLSSLIQTKVDGITRGFLTHLKIEGVGYRASVNDKSLSFRVGFSHQVYFNVPPSIRVFLLDPTTICLYGIDKNQVFQTAAKICSIRPPSPYKKRGIRFLDETFILKEGKRK